MAHSDGDLTIIVGGAQITGWERVRVSRSCERVPPSFELVATQSMLTLADARFPPGTPCQIMIGSDLVMTGYVDQVLPSIGPSHHDVRIRGRGKCEDLVDCSITTDILNGMQITTLTLSDLATDLCKHFGDPTSIVVKSPSGSKFPVTQYQSASPLVFNAILLETPYEILEKVARYAAALIYEGETGALVLGAVGDGGTMASGFTQGGECASRRCCVHYE